jgi:hypothetical protein
MSEASTLKRVIETQFTQGVATDFDGLRRFLEHPEFPDRAREFKAELADAILNHRISPKEFEDLTAMDQDSQEDVDDFLTKELWATLYPNEPVRLVY